MHLEIITREDIEALQRLFDEKLAELQAELSRLQSPAVASPWMTGAEVCKYLCISRGTLRNRVKAGKLTVHYIDGLARYARAEVEKL